LEQKKNPFRLGLTRDWFWALHKVIELIIYFFFLFFKAGSLTSMFFFAGKNHDNVQPAPTQEVALFVGFPGSGKTQLFRKRFAPSGYVHVNQVRLKDDTDC
jgi:hypothetical protein